MNETDQFLERLDQLKGIAKSFNAVTIKTRLGLSNSTIVRWRKGVNQGQPLTLRAVNNEMDKIIREAITKLQTLISKENDDG